MTSSSTNQPEETGANGGGKPGHYYSYGIPYLSIANYPGKLIAVEGTDGVGRSTQISLLREWLESYRGPTPVLEIEEPVLS